jgi:hypothetical protein
MTLEIKFSCQIIITKFIKSFSKLRLNNLYSCKESFCQYLTNGFKHLKDPYVHYWISINKNSKIFRCLWNAEKMSWIPTVEHLQMSLYILFFKISNIVDVIHWRSRYNLAVTRCRKERDMLNLKRDLQSTQIYNMVEKY